MNTVRTISFLSILLFFTSLAVAQTIRIVDNNGNAPSGPHVYSTIQEAHDAADHGDIVHIIPSPFNYGNATLIKQLHFYGIGFNPDRELKDLSEVGTFYFESTLFDNPSGSTFQGIKVTGSINSITQSVIKNIVIRNSAIGSFQSVLPVENFLFENNIIVGIVLILPRSNPMMANAVIRNNIFLNNSLLSVSDYTLISNNLFYGDGESWSVAFDNLNYAIVTNNIFYGKQPIPMANKTIEYSEFNNNVYFGPSQSTFLTDGNNSGINNLVGVNPDFENTPFSSPEWQQNWNFSWNPSFKPGSPALNAGSDGSDIGLFGGGAPFHSLFTGGTPLPFVRLLTTPGMILEGQDMLIDVQARGN